ncbi:MAG: hypothetical protein HRU12_10050 [Phaeodactylibacter sp.]|nr:hypothetical protein [Phaeodactylibacter sp.]
MDFRYNEYFATGDLTNMADTFDIDIFNLSTDSYKALISEDEVQIKFYTGYGDEGELSLAFEGIVSNVTGRRQIPEHITTLWCIPKGLAKVEKSISYQGTREDTLSSVLDGIGGLLGLTVKYEGVDDLVDVPYRAKTIEGKAIDQIVEMGNQFYFMPRVEGDELRIITLPEDGRIDRLTTVHHLRAELIRGVPKASVAKLSIPYAFNTVIRTGEVIDTGILEGEQNNSVTGGIGDPNGITDVSGLGKGSLHYADTLYKWAIQTKYQIVSAAHSGSNYTDTYISQYECVAYVPNTKGA